MLDALSDFHLYLQSGGLNSKEIQRCKSDIFLLTRWVESKKLGNSWSHKAVKLYFEALETHKSPTEVMARRQSVAFYLWFLYRVGLVDPAWYFRKTDQLTIVPRWLTAEEQHSLLVAINNFSFQELRPAALVGLLFTTGLWPTQISMLKMKDIRLSSLELYVDGASPNYRQVHGIVDLVLSNYLHTRPLKAETFAFSDDKGNPINPDYVRKAVAQLSHEAGLKGVTVRVLQHTCAKNLRDKEGAVRAFIYLRQTKHQRYAYAKPDAKQLIFSKEDLASVSPHSAPGELLQVPPH
jgi:site-specific recombinase XerD